MPCLSPPCPVARPSIAPAAGPHDVVRPFSYVTSMCPMLLVNDMIVRAMASAQARCVLGGVPRFTRAAQALPRTFVF